MTKMLVTAFSMALVASCSEPRRADTGNAAATVDAPTPAAGTPLAVSAADPKLQWGPCPPIFSDPGCAIAVLNGDPAKPNADVFLRVPGGYAIPPHRHTSAERMVLVSGEMRVRYQGNEPATLATGSYAYGPAGLPHEATCLSSEPCILFIAFEGPVDAEPVTGPLA